MPWEFELLKKRQQEYQKREHVRAKNNAWNRENRKQPHIRKRAREYKKKRMQSNPSARVAAALRGRVREVFLSQGLRKTDKTFKLVGCSHAELRAHLEAQFTEGMTWENYGAWEIDHRIPCRAFDLTLPEHRSACFHFTNLQPLWRTDNRRKSGKLKEQLARDALFSKNYFNSILHVRLNQPPASFLLRHRINTSAASGGTPSRFDAPVRSRRR
jgi:hypothetical protein